MAKFKHYEVTLVTGTAQPLTSVANRAYIQQAIINNDNQNAFYIGDSSVTTSSYGRKCAAGGAERLGPFSGEGPIATDEVYFLGTTADVVHVLAVLH